MPLLIYIACGYIIYTKETFVNPRNMRYNQGGMNETREIHMIRNLIINSQEV